MEYSKEPELKKYILKIFEFLSKRRASKKILRSTLSALRDEYYALTLEGAKTDSQIIQQLNDIFARLDKESYIANEHIRTAARLLIEIIPEENIYFRAIQIRKSLDDLSILGQHILSCEFNAKLEKFSTLPANEKRALAREMQRARTAALIDLTKIENFKLWTLSYLTTCSLMLFFTLAASTFYFSKECNIPVALFCFAAAFGTLGAAISSSSRLLGTDPETLAFLSKQSEPDIIRTSSFWISPLFGAIGATIILAAITNDLVIIDSIPNLRKVTNPVSEICNAASSPFDLLKNGTKINKLSFIAIISLAAGWSERLVPDILGSIGQSIKLNKRSNPSA